MAKAKNRIDEMGMTEIKEAGKLVEFKVRPGTKKKDAADAFMKHVEGLDQTKVPKQVEVTYQKCLDLWEGRDPKVEEPDAEGKKTEKPAEEKTPKVTKKSVIVDMLKDGSKGYTIQEFAEKITEAGLGDLDTNKKTAALWLRKIGFEVKKDEEGRWSAA